MKDLEVVNVREGKKHKNHCNKKLKYKRDCEIAGCLPVGHRHCARRRKRTHITAWTSGPPYNTIHITQWLMIFMICGRTVLYIYTHYTSGSFQFVVIETPLQVAMTADVCRQVCIKSLLTLGVHALALCVLKAQEVTTKGVHRLPHAIYRCSSLCQTLRELYTSGRPRVNAY